MPRTGAPTLRAHATAIHVRRKTELPFHDSTLQLQSEASDESARTSAPNPANATRSEPTPHLRSMSRSLVHAASARARAALAACQATHVAVAMPVRAPEVVSEPCALASVRLPFRVATLAAEEWLALAEAAPRLSCAYRATSPWWTSLMAP